MCRLSFLKNYIGLRYKHLPSSHCIEYYLVSFHLSKVLPQLASGGPQC